MGAVAFPCLPLERNPAERVVIHSVLYWVLGDKRDRDGTIQSVPWQHFAVSIFSLPVDEPDLSRCPTL